MYRLISILISLAALGANALFFPVHANDSQGDSSSGQKSASDEPNALVAQMHETAMPAINPSLPPVGKITESGYRPFKEKQTSSSIKKFLNAKTIVVAVVIFAAIATAVAVPVAVGVATHGHH